MSPAAGAMTPSNSIQAAQMKLPTKTSKSAPTTTSMTSEAFAKDAIMAWFRGEFAAANAIIDALCNHLGQLESGLDGGSSKYRSVFAAIHRRRLNWIPVLQMQKYYPITDVAAELRKVTEERNPSLRENGKSQELPVADPSETKGSGDVDQDSNRDDSPESEITDTGSQEVLPIFDKSEILLCSNHADCEARHTHFKMTKGFVTKELVKGRTINVVRGLKLYEDVFSDVELSKLTDSANELRSAGRNGELPGETFILYNLQSMGKKKELIQLGAPIFRHIKDESGHIEPIPSLLQGVINHLVQWHLISESRKPNSCIINFFDEGECSQPFLKPPHLDQPIIMLVLSESMIAFGRTLVSDMDGSYKGPLMLSLKEGSVLVMRGHSADMARHVMCPSPNKRVSITFFRVRKESHNHLSAEPSLGGAMSMTVWQPEISATYTVGNIRSNGHEVRNMIPNTRWGVFKTPVIMLSPVVRPTILSPQDIITNSGTGVFLPWTVGSRKPAKHLPPRARRARLLSLPSSVEMHNAEPDSSSYCTSI